MSEFPRIHQQGDEKLMEGVFFLPDLRRVLIFAGDLKVETDKLGKPFCEVAAVLATVRAILTCDCTAEAATIKVYLPLDGPQCTLNPLCSECKKGSRR